MEARQIGVIGGFIDLTCHAGQVASLGAPRNAISRMHAGAIIIDERNLLFGRTVMKSGWLGLAILLLLPANSVFARPPQSLHYEDDQNVVDAARRAREQKKEQPQAGKVWDNESIPKKPGDVSVIGQTPAAAEADDSAAGAGAKEKDAAAAASDKTEAAANESASGAPATAPAAGGAAGAAS